MMKLVKLAVLLGTILWALPAAAQSVQQSDKVTPGHAAKWISNGIIGDAGTAQNGSLSSLGVTNNGGPGICVNSAPITGPYNQTCISTTTNGGSKLSSYAYGGATNPGFVFDINGSTQGFPAVTLPVTNNNYACFDGTTGTLKDCAASPTSSLDQYHFFIGNGANVPVDTALAGDCTYGALGIVCTKTNGVAFAASATTDTTNASNINSGTLATARLPSPFTNGTRSGNTSSFATTTGTLTSGNCVQFDASGNIVASGGSCVSGRTKLTTATTFYVSTTGTNVAGCGIASGVSACRTRGYLFDILRNNYDLGGQTITISIADGTYTDSFQATGPMLIGQVNAAGVIFQGNCTTPTNVLMQPAGAAGYAYSASGGVSYRITCQKFDMTTAVRAGTSNDMIVVGQNSNIYFGDQSLYGVRADITFGCNINPYNTITMGFYAYVEFDNDFNIDVGTCQVTTTGTITSGTNTLTSVASLTNVVKYMNIVVGNVPLDAYVTNASGSTITFSCIYTSPCQSSGSTSGATLTLTGGGQSFLNAASSAIVYFNTNGDPSYSIIGALGNYPFYYSGWFFINTQAAVNVQAVTWTSNGQAHGRCSVVKTLSNIDTGLQGIPYLPCNTQLPEVSKSSVSTTAGASTFTVSSNAGIALGQIVTDVVNTTATWTAGSATIVVSSATGLVTGMSVNGPGILSGAKITNIAGTTITLGTCGAGPRCVTGNPTYLAGTGASLYFTGGLFSNQSVVTNINSTTITISDTLKGTGTAGTIWFQGQVYNYSVYD